MWTKTLNPKSHHKIFFFQDVVVMAQKLEKFFREKVATMPPEVSAKHSFINPTLHLVVNKKLCQERGILAKYEFERKITLLKVYHSFIVQYSESLLLRSYYTKLVV